MHLKQNSYDLHEDLENYKRAEAKVMGWKGNSQLPNASENR